METTSLRSKLDSDLKQSLRGGDKVKVSVIRLVMAAVGTAESARQARLVESATKKTGSAEGLDSAELARQARLEDPAILAVISKEAKQREESIAAFKQGNRPDLVAREEAELVILRAYLPKGATRDEIMAEARKIIAETGAQGARDKGKVMPKLIAQFKGRAEGRDINEVVSELLK